MFDAVVFCPYCGTQQSEEQDLINFLKDQVWILSCRECEKDCVLILYDGVRGSVTKVKESGRNPDNPERCSELMKDGIHCFEKSASHSYDDAVIEGKESWLVKCPFIRVQTEGRKHEN